MNKTIEAGKEATGRTGVAGAELVARCDSNIPLWSRISIYYIGLEYITSDIYIYVYIYIRMYVRMYVYIYIYIYIQMYIHTYIHVCVCIGEAQQNRLFIDSII